MKEEYLRQRKAQGLILFGAGDYARRFYVDFHDSFPIAFCVSNDPEEDALVLDGEKILPVYRVEDGLKRGYREGRRDKIPGRKQENPLIVLCAADCQGMETQLGRMGYFCGKDYLSSDLFRLLLSEKKIALVYGVCYMRPIRHCLERSEAFGRDYAIFHWLSYRQMDAQEYAIFCFLLGICDLYLYNACLSLQEREKNGSFLERLPAGCKRVSVPVVGAAAYHPQAIPAGRGGTGDEALRPLWAEGDPNPYCVTSHKTAWAPFLSPDWNINRLLRKGLTAAQIVEIIGDGKYYHKEWLERNYERQLRKVQIQEAAADIKISDYLLERRGKERLFLNETHISNHVVVELAKRILGYLGYSCSLPEGELLESQLLYTSEVPLYPSVIHGLSLEVYQGENMEYDLFTFQGRKKVSFEEYVTLYCDFCGNMMRYMGLGLFPE